MTATAVPKFTLRFHDKQNHDLLGLIAEQLGVTKNQLAEEMLGRELRAAALLLETDLTGTLEVLKSYRPQEHLAAAIEEVAQAEGHETEPLQARMVEGKMAVDAFGITAAFS